MPDIDPITLCYDKLVTMLSEHVGFMTLVKKKNLITFSGKNRDPIKSEVSTGDLPEVRVLPRGGVPHIQRTSNSSSMIERFEVQISSGDQRVGAVLFPVKWEVYRALSGWAAALQALLWKSKTFVKLARPIDVSDGVAEDDLRRGIEGWASIWSVEIHMWFATTDLQGD